MAVSFRAVIAGCVFAASWVAAVVGAVFVPVHFGGVVALPLLAFAAVRFGVFGGLLRLRQDRSG